MRGIRVYSVVCAAICQTVFSAEFASRAVEFEYNTFSVKNANATNATDIANATNQTAIAVALKFEGGPGQIPTTRAYITAGTNRFAFLVPDEFKLASSDSQKVTLMK